MRAKVGGGNNSFGGVNPGGANAAGSIQPTLSTAAAATDSPPTDDASDDLFTVSKLEACFDNLANAAKAKQSSLDELVKSLAALTATNSEPVAANKKLAGEHTNLHHEINALRKRGGNSKQNFKKNLGRRKPCKHYGAKNHDHADCLELPQNASKRAAGWESKL